MYTTIYQYYYRENKVYETDWRVVSEDNLALIVEQIGTGDTTTGRKVLKSKLDKFDADTDTVFYTKPDKRHAMLELVEGLTKKGLEAEAKAKVYAESVKAINEIYEKEYFNV